MTPNCFGFECTICHAVTKHLPKKSAFTLVKLLYAFSIAVIVIFIVANKRVLRWFFSKKVDNLAHYFFSSFIL